MLAPKRRRGFLQTMWAVSLCVLPPKLGAVRQKKERVPSNDVGGEPLRAPTQVRGRSKAPFNLAKGEDFRKFIVKKGCSSVSSRAACREKVFGVSHLTWGRVRRVSI